ncbi:MAG: hypothetical protein GX640_07665 [Fibrobacter sp.]|nr:hypothetical protein [Fibrobacter sp.]
MKALKTYTFLLFCFFASTNTTGAYTLDSTFIRSDSCVQIEWVPDSQNTNPAWYLSNGVKCTGADSIYRRCDFVPGNTYYGVAYSYGGEDPYYLFRNRLKQGFLVGSHLCHYLYYNDPSNIITGTDCSGFLCYLWNYPRISTTSFANSSVFKKIDFSEIRPGDALVKSGSHIVFVLEADTISEVVISEASSTARGCRERLVNLTDPEWTSYKAIRYPQLSNTVPVYSPVNKHTQSFFIKYRSPSGSTIEFTEPFQGELTIMSLDGRVLQRTRVNFQRNVPLYISFHGTVIVYQDLVTGKPVTRRVLIP